MEIEKTVQLYEGKAKKVYATTDENLCIVSYKDDATAFNGLKKGTIAGKGVVNNRMTNMLMQILEKNGRITEGEVLYKGQDIRKLYRKRLAKEKQIYR